jgi:hypothetical protein
MKTHTVYYINAFFKQQVEVCGLHIAGMPLFDLENEFISYSSENKGLSFSEQNCSHLYGTSAVYSLN